MGQAAGKRRDLSGRGELFEQLGFYYVGSQTLRGSRGLLFQALQVGPIDGHDMDTLVQVDVESH